MGWLFLNSLRPRRQRKRRVSQAGIARRRLVGGVKWCLCSIMVMACLFGWHMLEKVLTNQAIKSSKMPVVIDHVLFETLPHWMDSQVRLELQEAAAWPIKDGDLSHRNLQRSVESLYQTGWVRQVHQIKRDGMNSIMVSADYRRRVAAIASPRGIFRVDRESVRLPGDFDDQSIDMIGVPIITAVSLSPPPVGHQWLGEDVAGGLSVAQLIQDQPYVTQIEAIDVSQTDRQRRIRVSLHTHRGLIRWGLAPGYDHPLEPSTEVKLHRLMQIYSRWQAVDAGGKVVDLYGPTTLIRLRRDHDHYQPVIDTGSW